MQGRKNKFWASAMSLVVLALATGCAVGPNYRRPVVEVPNSFGILAEQDALPSDLGWWEIVRDDPVLKDLVVEAINKNQDLRIAIKRMEEARALAGINHLWPSIDAGASARRQRGLVAGAGPKTVLGNNFSADLSASWELDLWGRIRRSRESDQAQYLASEYGRRAVLLSLIGDVVGGYYQLQALDMQLETARRTVEVRRKSLVLVDRRMIGGVGDKLETSQSASSVALAEATVPQFEQAVHEQENRLNLLLGRIPGPIERGGSLQAIPPKSIAPDLPSTLLERRPDVKRSEELLRAANAQVGVATANLFPSLRLTGSLGYQSMELSDLTSGSQKAWSVGGGLLAPVFRGGELRRQRQATIARWEQAKASYEKTVLTALGDTSNALKGVTTAKGIVKAQMSAVDSLKEAERIATMRYEGGVSPYLEVLDAQRQLFSAELSLAEALCEQQKTVIRLYLALGGGWSQPERPTENPPLPQP